MKKWSMKPTVYTGSDCLKRLEQFENEKVCLVCDPYLVGTKSFEKILQNLSASCTTEIFSEIIPDPPIETVVLGVEKMQVHQPTVLVAIGGGSAIDTAKAMLFMHNKLNQNAPKIKRFIAIPTTSGTGSEVTSASVVTDTQNKIKYPIFHEELLPDEALLAAELVVSSPQKVTAYSGMDVLTHALEALVAKNSSIYTDSLAEKAIELVFGYLEDCYKTGDHLAVRVKMHQASCLAGLAFDAAGLGASHALAHQVGAQFKVPHGLANSMLLPYVVEMNTKDQKSLAKYAWVAQKLGFGHKNLPNHLSVASLKKEISALANRLNCPKSLSQFGVDKQIAESKTNEIVKNAMKDVTYATNPLSLSEVELSEIYRKII